MENDNSIDEILVWSSLPDLLKLALPSGYLYLIKKFNQLPSYQTFENFLIPQFELEAFININDKEKVHKWFQAFESHSKTMMHQTKGYGVKGKKEEVRERFLELFGDGHLPTSAIYSYEDSLHTTAESDQELLEMLAD
ncbi:hypothetical protein C1646_758607 [Rhizophagus diaphanus]|nr:hypothetical protein C1646_758607 [Rhizophagus diaphanus] [Rhizophagus sp. MUCL 43196]